MIFYPNLACLQMATELKAALALSKVRLFKTMTNDEPPVPFVPTVSTTSAELENAECDFDGYPAGGITVTAMLAPLLDPAGGASIESPVVQFAWAHVDTDVGNVVAGFWLEDAAGILRMIGVLPVPIPLQGPGQGIPLTFKCVEPTGVGV